MLLSCILLVFVCMNLIFYKRFKRLEIEACNAKTERNAYIKSGWITDLSKNDFYTDAQLEKTRKKLNSKKSKF